MESRIMQVFYGNDCLPYKDKERSVHYPVVGNSFTGASDTTKIRFYVKEIGGVENVTWVAVVKLPNGKIGFKILSTIGNDLDVGERYVEFSLNSFYTQYNGDLAIALKGYQGGVQVEEDAETGIYEIVGTPTIQATGVIKLSVNYSTQLPLTQGLSPDELTQLMALIADKLNIASGIVVLLNDDEDISGYTNGQLFYVVSRNQFMQLVENELEEKELNVYNVVPGQQATLSIIANNLTNINGRYLSSYESNSVVISDYQCYKITRGGENLNEEYAAAYMEFMTGSKYLPKYDYEHPKNTYFINPDGLILKPQYDDTNGLLLYPMTYLATRNYVDNDIISIADTSTPLTYDQRQKILTKNVRVQYNNHYYEKVKENSYSVTFECAELNFTTSSGSTTISKNIINIIKATGTIVASVKNLVTYSQAQANQYFASNVQMSVDSNYVLKVKLIDKNGDQLAEDSVDLPLESIVQSAQYYETYTYQGTTYEDVIVITLATTSVPTIIPVGDLVSGLVSENTFNTELAKKVDKTNNANKVYGTNGSGSQTTYNVDSNVSGNVVRRDNNSQIIVPTTPTNNAHATSKGYVDTFAKDVALSLDQSTYVLTITLKNANNGTIVTRSVDLPLETMVVSGSYDEINKAIVLTLKNGQTISIPVGDLISGLVSTDYLQTYYYNKTQIDDMVSGFVFADVDDYLSSVSTNPVENRVITLALETKANVDGNYQTMTVGVADNLSPYDENSGDDQDTPFILQATGTGNGTQPDFSTGSFALMKEKQGNTVVVNQLVNPSNLKASGSGTNYSFTTNQTTGEITLVVSDTIATETNIQLTANSSTVFLKVPTGHTVFYDIHNSNNKIRFVNEYNGQRYYQQGIFNQPAGAYGYVFLGIILVEGLEAGTYKINLKVTDLTQWFNGDIQQDILDNPSNFFRYYQGSLAYNTGALVNANGRYIKCIGMNQWDEETQVVNNTYLTTKNYQKCIGGQTYYIKTPSGYGTTGSTSIFTNGFYWYDANFNKIGATIYEFSNHLATAPANACYFKFNLPNNYGTTYNNDVSINLYYEDEPRCLTYEPYQVLTNNDTGVEVLRKARNVKDTKAPDGTITRRIGAYTFTGNETYTLVGAGGIYRFNDSGSTLHIKPVARFEDVGNLINEFNASVQSLNDLYDKVEYSTNNRVIGIYNSSGSIGLSIALYNDRASLVGKTIYFELAEPTTEQGTPFSENLDIDDFGSMDFGSDIPQGYLIFYPVDYKAFIDTFYKYTDGTPSNVALKSDLQPLNDKDTQLLNAVGGTLRQCLCVKESLDFDNTAFVDLGTLSWSYDNTHNCFYAKISSMKDSSNKIICSNYQTKTTYEMVNKSVTNCHWNVTNELNVYDNSFGTDTTTFKNAMKGVLLAYEKA